MWVVAARLEDAGWFCASFYLLGPDFSVFSVLCSNQRGNRWAGDWLGARGAGEEGGSGEGGSGGRRGAIE